MQGAAAGGRPRRVVAGLAESVGGELKIEKQDEEGFEWEIRVRPDLPESDDPQLVAIAGPTKRGALEMAAPFLAAEARAKKGTGSS